MSNYTSVKVKIAFVSSNFGFGPVSKAVSIAEEIKRTLPHSEIVFFGNGISLDFASQSKIFDLCFNAEVDKIDLLKNIVPLLKTHDYIFSILNLPLLSIWNKNFGKLFFVDSLAWMWKQPPQGIENAEIYFVQDYLVTPDRIKKWSNLCRLMLFPPIGLADNLSTFLSNDTERRTNRLLVNFSGCFNNYVESVVYENYAETLLDLIIKTARKKFNKIEVCVNRKLADKLKERFTSEYLHISQLEKKEFLKVLADSRFLLTAPGITTTLEAIVLNTPLGFLLPQNDSQAIMSELYRRQIDEKLTMAFSRFNKSPDFQFSLGEYVKINEPIEVAANSMNYILYNYRGQIRKFLTEMFDCLHCTEAIKILKENVNYRWNKTGQELIAEILKTK